MAKHEVIGKAFRTNLFGTLSPGTAVASPEGFFLVTAPGVAGVAEMSRAGAGLFGRPFAWIQRFFEGDRFERERDLGDLPDSILGDPDWPVRQNSGSVVPLPKNEVIALRLSWTGYLRIKVPRATYRVAVGNFNLRKVRGILSGMGWEL